MAPKEISRGILLPGKEEDIFDRKTPQGKGKAVEERAAEMPTRLHPDTAGKVFTGQMLSQTCHSCLNAAWTSRETLETWITSQTS